MEKARVKAFLHVSPAWDDSALWHLGPELAGAGQAGFDIPRAQRSVKKEFPQAEERRRRCALRLLLFNLVTDASDPVLGFGCVWIRELARHCDSIDVLTMYQGETDFPEHVRVFSAGRERDWSKARRLAQFYRLLTQLLGGAAL